MENQNKYSGYNWTAIKNSSWGEEHKQIFGEKEGYVICYRKNSELIALCSVIGQPFVSQTEIEANAKLIAAAPDLLKALVSIVEYWNTPNKGSLNNHIEHTLGLAQATLDKINR